MIPKEKMITSMIIHDKYPPQQERKVIWLADDIDVKDDEHHMITAYDDIDDYNYDNGKDKIKIMMIAVI